MSKMLSMMLAAGLLLTSFATYGADYGSQPSQDQQVPPVAQPLVREGDFAIKLAAQLNLGSPTDEATAEGLLAEAGIIPLSGWISDYPVTPAIIGQLSESIAKAADEGRLSMTGDEAKRALYTVSEGMNLGTPASAEAAGAKTRDANSTVINNYYYDNGPPVITYYPPPPAYVYLYDWVPFPVFWFGFWFPGFFICHNFTTVVTITPFPHSHFIRRGIVTNHIVDRVTRRVARVDPVVRTGRGAVRSETMIRTGSGRTFRNIADWRRDAGVNGGRSFAAPRTFNAPSNSPRANMPSMPQKSFNSPSSAAVPRVAPRAARRTFNAPTETVTRQFAPPSPPAQRSTGSTGSRSFAGGGWQGRPAGGFGHGSTGRR